MNYVTKNKDQKPCVSFICMACGTFSRAGFAFLSALFRTLEVPCYMLAVYVPIYAVFTNVMARFCNPVNQCCEVLD